MTKRVRLGWAVAWLLSTTAAGAAQVGSARSADGNRIEYLVAGRGEPAIVFVGGWAGEKEDWGPQLDRFSSGHRVVALDLPGFGRSGREREVWSIASYGADVLSVMEALGVERAVLVGHSMGSGVVLEAALLAPGRIVGLVPVDVFHDVEEKLTSEQVRDRVDGMMRFVEEATEESVRALYPPEADDETIRAALETYRSAPKEIWRAAAEDYFDWRNRLPETLERLETPIHCINSDRFETELAKARRYAPAFDVTVVEGVGHAVMLEAPEAFDSALEAIVRGFARTTAP